MSYLSTSRYIEEQENDRIVGVLRSNINRFVGYTTYTTRYGDRLDQVAARLYGDPTRWWEIAEINPEVSYPGVLAAGIILRVPTS